MLLIVSCINSCPAYISVPYLVHPCQLGTDTLQATWSQYNFMLCPGWNRILVYTASVVVQQQIHPQRA